MPFSRCEETRPALFEYMTRELGSNRSELVREHLRHCHDCSLEAREIQTTAL